MRTGLSALFRQQGISESPGWESWFTVCCPPSIELSLSEKDFVTGLTNMRAFLDYAERTASRHLTGRHAEDRYCCKCSLRSGQDGLRFHYG